MLLGYTVKDVFKGHCNERTPADQGMSSKVTAMRGHQLIRGCFLKLCPIFPYAKKPAMEGHLLYRDTFSGILRMTSV